MATFFAPPAEAFFAVLPMKEFSGAATLGKWQVTDVDATPAGGPAQSHDFPAIGAGGVGSVRIEAAAFPAATGRFLIVVRTLADNVTYDVAIHDSVAGHGVVRRVFGFPHVSNDSPRIQIAPNSDGSLLFLWRRWTDTQSDLHIVLRPDTLQFMAMQLGVAAALGVRGAYVDGPTHKCGIGVALPEIPIGRWSFGLIMDEQVLPAGRVALDAAGIEQIFEGIETTTRVRAFNSGNDLAKVTSVAVFPAANFRIKSQAPAFPLDLNPGDAFAFNVSPIDANKIDAKVSVTYLTAAGTQTSLFLLNSTNAGAAGQLQILPARPRFAADARSNGSNSKSLELFNSGAVSLTVSIDAAGAGPFRWAAVNTASIGPGQSLTVPVTFEPPAPTSFVGKFLVHIKPPTPADPGHTVAVDLLGNAPPKPMLGDLAIGPSDVREVVRIRNLTGNALDLAGCTVHGRWFLQGQAYSNMIMRFEPSNPALSAFIGAQVQFWSRAIKTGDPGAPTDFYAGPRFWNPTGDTVFLVDSFGVELVRWTSPEPAVPTLPVIGPTLAEEKIVAVPAKSDWVETGVRFRNGDILKFVEWSNFVPNPERRTSNDPGVVKDPTGHASQVKVFWNSASFDADGANNEVAPTNDPAWPMGGVAKYALVGRAISDPGAPAIDDERFVLGADHSPLEHRLDPVIGVGYPTGLELGTPATADQRRQRRRQFRTVHGPDPAFSNLTAGVARFRGRPPPRMRGSARPTARVDDDRRRPRAAFKSSCASTGAA